MASGREYRNSQKRLGLQLLVQKLHKPLANVLRHYVGKYFENSIVEKKVLFEEILTDSISESNQAFLVQRCSLAYHKDTRNALGYAKDLVFGWLAEDIVLETLLDMRVELTLAGKDRKREFLNEDQIDTASDYEIQLTTGVRKMELVISWNDYWISTNKLDIRDSKFRRMTSDSKCSILLGLEPMSSKFFIMDLSKTQPLFEWRMNPAWGNKGVLTLTGIKDYLQDFSKFEESVLGHFEEK